MGMNKERVTGPVNVCCDCGRVIARYRDGLCPLAAFTKRKLRVVGRAGRVEQLALGSCLQAIERDRR
jgi:hypothetical protein